jgi:hypothetical protein
MSLSLTIVLVLYANLVRSIRELIQRIPLTGWDYMRQCFVAHWVEHTTDNRGVAGSNPA